MSEIEVNQIDFSNILFKEESQILDNSFEFEVNDLINEKRENEDNENDTDLEIEENVIYDKNIPKIFQETKILSLKKAIQEKEELNPKFNSFNQNSTIKNEENINKTSLSRRTTSDQITNKKNLKIDVLNIILGEEKRTMIIIENIPSKYNIKFFKGEIDSQGFKGKYNLIYFHKINSKFNNIYINFIHELHIISFYERFNGKKINNIDKIINMKYCNLDENEFKALIVKENSIEINNINFNFQNFEIPLSYLSLFKKIYSNSVCIIKEHNIYNEGTFLVKKL